jgi:ribonuclease D
MSSRLITEQSEFLELCDRIRTAGVVGFDTEFVSEFYFQPRLCLLQFALPEESWLVDPFEVEDLTPWWDIMTDDQTTIICHGAREEIRFCLRYAGAPPNKFVDVQIAEGLLSRGFPVSYKNLVGKVMGLKVHSSETRSNWEHRPLTQRQVDYALEDVSYLIEIWRRQTASLTKQGRQSWAEGEFQRMLDDLAREQDRESWRRLPGTQGLRPRDQAVVRALYDWRIATAQKLDRPPRTVFRDDMLMEVAKRQPATLHELNMTRGMVRKDYQRFGQDLLNAIQAALDLPEEDLPKPERARAYPASDDALSRLLSLALSNRCAEMSVSMSLVGNAADVENLVHWHIHHRSSQKPPKLLQGWRGEVCGTLLTDLLDGSLTLRVVDPRSDAPLRFEPYQQKKDTP